MAPPPLHPDLEPLAFLLGEWEGPGEGSYPTIEPFAYTERLTFTHGGKPFLAYAQRSWSPEGAPLHVETGYLRPGDASADGHGVEVVLSQPTGVVEVLTGTVEDHRVLVRTVVVARTPTAKEVTEVERELRLDGGRLVTRLAMAAVGEPLTHHLASTLARVDA